MLNLEAMLLSNAILVVPLAIGVTLVTPFIRRPALTWALWGIVLLKFVTPAFVPLSVPAELTVTEKGDTNLPRPKTDNFTDALLTPAVSLSVPSLNIDEPRVAIDATRVTPMAQGNSTIVLPMESARAPSLLIAGDVVPAFDKLTMVDDTDWVNNSSVADPWERTRREDRGAQRGGRNSQWGGRVSSEANSPAIAAQSLPVGQTPPPTSYIADTQHKPSTPAASSNRGTSSVPARRTTTIGNVTQTLQAEWRRIVRSLWIAGAVLVAAICCWRAVRFWRVLRTTVTASPEIQSLTTKLAGELRLRRVPRVRTTTGRVPPLLWAGVLRPTILLPRELWDSLDQESRQTLLAHELAHLARRDHWTRWLELAVRCLYWWHPVAWWAGRKLREAEELCCDARVVSLLPESTAAYAHTILTTIDYLAADSHSIPTLATGLRPLRRSVRPLHRRLTMIVHDSLSTKTSWLSRLVVLVLAAGILPTVLVTEPAAEEVPPPLAFDSPADIGQSAADSETFSFYVGFEDRKMPVHSAASNEPATSAVDSPPGTPQHRGTQGVDQPIESEPSHGTPHNDHPLLSPPTAGPENRGSPKKTPSETLPQEQEGRVRFYPLVGPAVLEHTLRLVNTGDQEESEPADPSISGVDPTSPPSSRRVRLGLPQQPPLGVSQRSSLDPVNQTKPEALTAPDDYEEITVVAEEYVLPRNVAQAVQQFLGSVEAGFPVLVTSLKSGGSDPFGNAPGTYMDGGGYEGGNGMGDAYGSLSDGKAKLWVIAPAPIQEAIGGFLKAMESVPQESPDAKTMTLVRASYSLPSAAVEAFAKLVREYQNSGLVIPLVVKTSGTKLTLTAPKQVHEHIRKFITFLGDHWQTASLHRRQPQQSMGMTSPSVPPSRPPAASREVLEFDLQIAQLEVETAEEKVEFTKRLVAKGYKSPTDLKAAELELLKAQRVVKQLEAPYEAAKELQAIRKQFNSDAEQQALRESLSDIVDSVDLTKPHTVAAADLIREFKRHESQVPPESVGRMQALQHTRRTFELIEADLAARGRDPVDPEEVSRARRELLDELSDLGHKVSEYTEDTDFLEVLVDQLKMLFGAMSERAPSGVAPEWDLGLEFNLPIGLRYEREMLRYLQFQKNRLQQEHGSDHRGVKKLQQQIEAQESQLKPQMDLLGSYVVEGVNSPAAAGAVDPLSLPRSRSGR